MGTKNWYVKLASGPIGPMSSSQLRRLADSGAVCPTSLVRLANSKRWVMASKVQGLLDVPACGIASNDITKGDASPPLPLDRVTSKDSPSAMPTWLSVSVGLTIGGVVVGLIVTFMPLPSGSGPSEWFGSPQVASTSVSPADEVEAKLSISQKADGVVEVSGLKLAGDFAAKKWDPNRTQDLLHAADDKPIEEVSDVHEGSTPAVSNAESAVTAKMIAERIRRSCVTIRVSLKDGSSIGSGFVIENDRSVVTCLHVVKGAEKIEVELSSGKLIPCLVFRALSESSDLVVLRTAQPCESPPLLLATEIAAQGDVIYAFGSPKGLSGTFSSGIVSAIRSGNGSITAVDSFRPDGVALIQFTAAISPGSSGGPLVDARGQVVGVVAAEWPTAEDVYFATAIHHLSELLEVANKGSEHLLVELPERPKRIESTEISDIAAATGRVADELKKQREEREKTRKLFEAIASRQEQNNERKGDLSKLQKKISDARIVLQRMNAEGNNLMDQHDTIQAKGRVVYENGMRTKSQIHTFERHISGIKNELLNRQAAAQQGKEYVGDPRSTAALSADLQQLRQNLYNRQAEAMQLEAAYIALDQQARSIQQQIAFKRNERDRLQHEIQELEKQPQSLLKYVP